MPRRRRRATGVLYDSATTRFWDTYLDGRFIGLFAVRLDGDKPPTEGIALARGYQGGHRRAPRG